MLKAKIVDGFLKVLRGESLTPQCCPISQHPDYVSNCGDHCPLFGEVVQDGWRPDETPINTLTICENKTFEVVE